MGSLALELDLREVVRLQRSFEAAPALVRRELTAATLEASLLLERETVERTPKGVGAGGGLAGSIAAREPEISGELVLGAVGTPLAHAEPVELGSRPHFPPIAPLEDWVRAKLGKSKEEARGVAFAVARKIAAEGTEGAFMFTTALAENEAQIARIYGAAAERVAAQLGESPGGGA